MGYTRSEPTRNNSDYTLYEATSYYANSHNSLQSHSSSNFAFDSTDEEIIPKIVEKIIKDKFYGTLRRIRQRSMERRRSKMNIEHTYEEIHDGKKGSDDSGLNIPSLEDFSENNCDDRIYETIGNESSRLSLGNFKSQTDNILGDFRISSRKPRSECKINKAYTKSIDYSIGSSNISSLLSTRFSSNHIYSTVNKSPQYSMKSQEILGSPDKQSITSDKSGSLIKEELINRIVFQLETMFQISKALNISYQKNVIKNDIQVEAEKMLLIATMKKEIIEKYMFQVTSEQADEPKICTNVYVTNLHFNVTSKMHQRPLKDQKWHFVCIANMGSIVTTSDVTFDEENDILKCEDFNFPNNTEDLDLQISLYALPVLQKKNWCLNVSPRKTPKKPNQNEVIREPAFQLWGKATINILRFRQKFFKLSYISNDAAILEHFGADIQHSQEIDIAQRGFLTIGKLHRGYPVWNTRWCYLQGYILKYWYYPTEEFVGEPLESLDLRNCTKIETRSEPSLCPKNRNLYLEFSNNRSVTKYYIFADSEEELLCWERTLNKVYDLLKKSGFLF